jgi:hypothetical protein
MWGQEIYCADTVKSMQPKENCFGIKRPRHTFNPAYGKFLNFRI